MGGAIDMRPKRCGSDPLCDLSFDFTRDLELAFKSSNLDKAVSPEWSADWHRTKGVWVDMMLDKSCEIELWPWPWKTFKVKFRNCNIQEWDGWFTWNIKDVMQIRCWIPYATLNFDTNHDLTLIFKVKFENETKGIWINRMMVALYYLNHGLNLYFKCYIFINYFSVWQNLLSFICNTWQV